jgi:tRNA G26 N,N-dimethylase Trm1
MRYLLLVVALLFCSCWEIRYTESDLFIEKLRRDGYEVKVTHTDHGVYRVKYRMPKDKEK